MGIRTSTTMRRPAMPALRSALLACALALSACATTSVEGPSTPVPGPVYSVPKSLQSTMAIKGMPKGGGMTLRIFKEEQILEVWRETSSGRYALLKTYSICSFSGALGPKKREGDRQAPEGFYRIAPAQMAPWSRNHLAFNMNFPNEFDRAHGRTGTQLMVHGGCTSSGCYAMTDSVMEAIYALAQDSFAGGNSNFLIQAFPFRMNERNMARHATNPHVPFWKMIKEGHDRFERTFVPPQVSVTGGAYRFR